MSEDRLATFLRLVSRGDWRPPAVWGGEIRRALSDRLVTIGFGGALKLTDAGARKAGLARKCDGTGAMIDAALKG